MNAEEARDLARKARAKSFEITMGKIEEWIASAAQRGEFSVLLDHKVGSPEIDAALRDLGYEVERGEGQRDGEWLRISW